MVYQLYLYHWLYFTQKHSFYVVHGQAGKGGKHPCSTGQMFNWITSVFNKYTYCKQKRCTTERIVSINKNGQMETLPPTIAQTLVKKCKNDTCCSVNVTCKSHWWKITLVYCKTHVKQLQIQWFPANPNFTITEGE
jgi:hypothetical protein